MIRDSYTMWQWIAFFVIYSFIGWCYESAYVSIKKRKWINRGFMRGPFLPLYGSGAVVMLIVSIPFRNSIPMTFIAGCIGATTLEYVTGVVMEALFKVRYWDYSKNKFNFQGHICLAATLAWGVFTVLLVYVIHAPIEGFVLRVPEMVLEILTFIISTYLVSDFSVSFKTALELRGVLVRMEALKEEMQRYQKRLDVILAFADDARDQAAMNTSQRLDELSASLEARLLQLKEFKEKYNARINSEEIREELEELRVRIKLSLEKRRELRIPKGALSRGMLVNNPQMISKFFKDGLEDLKEAAEHLKRDRK